MTSTIPATGTRPNADHTGDVCVLKSFGTVPLVLHPDQRVLLYRRFRSGVRFAPAGVDFRRFLNRGGADKVKEFERWENEQPSWVRAADVTPKDYIVSLPHQEVCGPNPIWRESRSAKHRPMPLNPADADVAWLFGLYIADGNAEPGRRIAITLNRTEVDTVTRAVRAFANLGLPSAVREFPTYYRVQVYSAVAADSFREWFGTSSHTKRIPPFLFSGWDIEAVVDGVMSGDGTEYNGACAITTTSPVLARQLHRALVRCGRCPLLTVQSRNGGEFPNARPGWVISWRPEGCKTFPVHWRGNYLMPVRKVETCEYSGPMWQTGCDGGSSFRVWNAMIESGGAGVAMPPDQDEDECN